ncbi:MAG: hypothetical protein ACFBSG_08175 [Leptolyngbyaceae cyanobacterium]
MTEQNDTQAAQAKATAGNPKEAEPGKGDSGSQWGVQTAQSTDVNDPEAKIPSNVDVEQNVEQLKAAAEQEEGTMPTTHGYVVGESGNINNFAVEPPMRVEED